MGFYGAVRRPPVAYAVIGYPMAPPWHGSPLESMVTHGQSHVGAMIANETPW